MMSYREIIVAVLMNFITVITIEYLMKVGKVNFQFQASCYFTSS